MEKFHINNEGNPGVCRAQNNCRFGDLESDHYSTREDAQQAYEEKLKTLNTPKPIAKSAKTKATRKPIILEPSELKNVRTPDAKDYVEVEYDFYECTGTTCESDPSEGICRDAAYENIQITGFEDNGFHNYVKASLGLPYDKDLPEDFKEILEKYKDPIDDFEIYTVGGYYGEEYEVVPSARLQKDIKNYYYNRPNAVDMNKVLPYIRGKGTETTGLTPIEAIKKQLKEENGRILKDAEEADAFKIEKIKTSKITRGSRKQTQLASDDPKEPKKIDGVDSLTVAGVVFQNKAGEYRLVDGYHRTAYLDKHQRQSGVYIILAKKSDMSYYERTNSGWIDD